MGQVQNIVKYYSNYFLILAESEEDVNKSNQAHKKHFILKNYEKSIHVYKMRFRNSRRDCIEKTRESHKAFYHLLPFNIAISIDTGSFLILLFEYIIVTFISDVLPIDITSDTELFF